MYKVKTFIVDTLIMAEPRTTVCGKIDKAVNGWIEKQNSELDGQSLLVLDIKNITVSAVNDNCSLVTVLYRVGV